VIQSKTANDAWVLLPGAKDVAIIQLSDASGAVTKPGYDEVLKMFTAERNGKKVYYAPWLFQLGIKDAKGQPILWTKNPLAPPPEKVLNAKTDAEMMQAAVESLNPGPEFKVWHHTLLKKPPEMITFKDALLLAIKRHETTDLKLPDFANLPPELANAPEAAIDLGGLPMKKVFAAYIGEVGALGPESDQMVRVQYDPTIHRYRLLINTAVLKPEYTDAMNFPDGRVSSGFANSLLAFANRAACEALVKERIGQDPSLENRLEPTLAQCNWRYHFIMASDVNKIDLFDGQITQGGKNLASKLWAGRDYSLMAQRVMFMFWERVNQKLVDWKIATAPRIAR